MQDQLSLGILAIAIGLVVGILLFVPFVTVTYRRRGHLGVGIVVVAGAALVYFMAIWTYTLLPLPDPDTLRCAGTNLNVGQFVDDIRGAIARPGNTLTDPAVLQLVLNVALFVPLGFFLRVLFGRGILVALIVGLAVSAFIETTQITGVWGVYPCAYRVFDVDDLLTNTTGAVLGSIVSLIVPRRFRGMTNEREDADEPRPVTRGRRFLAMLCDYVGVAILSLVTGVGVNVYLMYVHNDLDLVREGSVASLVASVVPLAIWLLFVVVSGQTVGDFAVQLRYRGGRVPVVFARLLRFIGGIGGYLLLGLVPGSTLWQGLFVLLVIVMFFATKPSRGLPGLVSGQQLVDAREPV